MNKLTEYQVVKIRQLHAVGMSGMELSRMFNISRRQVFNIVNNLQWKEAQQAVDTAEAVGTALDATVKVSAYSPLNG